MNGTKFQDDRSNRKESEIPILRHFITNNSILLLFK